MTRTSTNPLTGTGPGPAPGTSGPVAAREAMAARLESAGQLRPGPAREALLALRREVLIPQACVRRSAPGAEPPRWDLLDWTARTDRAELLDVLYGGASVLVQHDGEPLLGRDKGSAGRSDGRRSDPAGAFAHRRERVRDRLVAAQSQLPDGLRLLIVEGDRPLDLQSEYFERYSRRLLADHPRWTARQVRDAASRYVSPPEIAPHSAGAAVDLTLVDADGRELDMGTAMNATPEDNDGACFAGATNLAAAAKANRPVLTTAMTDAGLQPYPFEWWHALGQLTGHPDHRRAHQITLLAVEAAGLPHLYPDAGEPWQPAALYAATHAESGMGRLGPLLQRVGKTLLAVPDAYVSTVVDVSPWAAVKWEAICAHRSEVARERPLPGLLARLPEAERDEIIRTESFTRLSPGPAPGDPHRLAV
ncbi:M15 family metallopeptidase [Streptomyces sp. NPDC085942]|uniref:M15 family metallopeptidase n=1 Tax=Streptomyces sp. NPDC085942 TaxID=3365743 RepID=UPI0037D3110A